MFAGGLARAAGGDSTQPTRRAWRLSSDRAAGVVEQLKRLAARFHVALANYDAGRRAIERARNHDEAADIRDKAEALAAYARQAKDKDLLAWVTEIKVRAERRAGELVIEGQKNGQTCETRR